jgi:hypothetical protein
MHKPLWTNPTILCKPRYEIIHELNNILIAYMVSMVRLHAKSTGAEAGEFAVLVIARNVPGVAVYYSKYVILNGHVRRG